MVVDLGGSQGHVAIPLARKFPDITVIVQDMGSVVKPAESALAPDLVGRVKFMEHDFFTTQTVQADVYYIRWILHNWSVSDVLGTEFSTSIRYWIWGFLC